MRPKVLFLSSCVNGGGAGRSLEVFLNYAGAELESHVVLPESGIIRERLKNASKFWIVPEFVERIHRSPYRWPDVTGWRWLHVIANWYAIPRAIYRIIQIAREVRPDVIYCNHMLAKPVGAFVGTWLRIPIIFHARNVHVHWFGKHFYQFLGRLKWVKLIICNSETSSTCYRTHSSEKVVVIANSVDLEGFNRKEINPKLREEFSIPKDAKIIGYLGRILPKKGIDVLIEAFAKIQKEIPTYLVLVGDNDGGLGHDLRREYETKVAAMNLKSHVIFTGFKSDVRPYLAEMDILALPSIEPESFGRTLIEAMALRIPCITTAHGGSTEVVEDGDTGLWVTPGDADQLASAMKKLFLDDTLRKRMGLNGENSVREKYDGHKQAQKTLSAIMNVAMPPGIDVDKWVKKASSNQDIV